MEQIPTEVMEKIEAECEQVFNEFYGTIDEQLFRRGAEFGYRLLCEGKEKEIAELQQEFKANYFLTESLYKEISELEAEKERLKEVIRSIEL